MTVAEYRRLLSVGTASGVWFVRSSRPQLAAGWDSAEVSGISGRHAGCNTSALCNKPMGEFGVKDDPGCAC